jgi:hypothetical protein
MDARSLDRCAAMPRIKSPGSHQRFLAIHAIVYDTFNLSVHIISRRTFCFLNARGCHAIKGPYGISTRTKSTSSRRR